jgi:hypothetical protein
MERDTDKSHESYERYLRTQCSYWSPGEDQFLAGEVVFQWSNRESIRSILCGQQAELAFPSDPTLSPTLSPVPVTPIRGTNRVAYQNRCGSPSIRGR